MGQLILQHENHLLIAALICFAIAGIATVCLITGCGSGPTADIGSSDDVPVLYLHDRAISSKPEITDMLGMWAATREDEARAKYSVSTIPDFKRKTINNFGFQCLASSTGWCAGMYIPNGGIYAPIYHRLTFDHRPTDAELQGMAVHTLISSDEICERTQVKAWCGLGRWSVGLIPDGQIGYPVLVHEIGHLIGRSVDSAGAEIYVTEMEP